MDIVDMSIWTLWTCLYGHCGHVYYGHDAGRGHLYRHAVDMCGELRLSLSSPGPSRVCSLHGHYRGCHRIDM
eukprot:364865-Chlamydomonas_euryale.AAC.4